MNEPSRRDPAPDPPRAVTPPVQIEDGPRASTGGRAGGQAPPPVHKERRSRTMGWRSTDVLRTAALVIAMYVALRLLWFANALVLTTFLAVLFGLAVAAGVDRLERFKIPRGVGAAMIVLSFFGLLTLLGLWMAPTLREQGAELRRRVPEAVDRLQDWVNRRQGFMSLLLRPPSAARPGAGATGEATRGTPRAGATPTPPPPQGASRDTAGDRPAGPPSASETLSSRLGGQMGGVVRYPTGAPAVT